jgi:hypothetical protein
MHFVCTHLHPLSSDQHVSNTCILYSGDKTIATSRHITIVIFYLLDDVGAIANEFNIYKGILGLAICHLMKCRRCPR